MITLDPLPMAEAQAFWRDKVQMGMGEFARLSAEAKLRAFAVSGIAKGDELHTVYAAMQRAIDQGTTLADFKKECAAIFERRGWTGKKAWRIDNLFRTNIQTAYNVGHYKQLMADGDLFPYWQYSAVNDSRTRPTHLAMDDRVWPRDHPVWRTWFPPNGYRCRCSVIGITRAQAERRGLTIETDDPTNSLIEPIDPETGSIMPARQLLPDVGFDHNPGELYWNGMAEVLTGRVESWPPALGQAILGEMVGSEVFAAWLAEGTGRFPLALGRSGQMVLIDVQAAGSLPVAAVELAVALAEADLPDSGEVAVLIGGAEVRLQIEQQDGKMVIVGAQQ